MAERVIAVAANKGGVGKTRLSYELAFGLDAVLVDLDWDRGGATGLWGFDVDRHRRSPLLEALVRDDRVPVPKRARGRPALVPSHPALVANQPEPEVLARKLTAWSAAWRQPAVVVDTHPGGVPGTYGAMMAAHLVIVPVILRPPEIDALQGTLEEFGDDYPVLLVPNLVPAHNPPLRLLERVERIVRRYGVPVAPPVSEHRWWARSTRRAALLSLSNPGARTRRAVAELRALTDTVKEMIHRGERP